MSFWQVLRLLLYWKFLILHTDWMTICPSFSSPSLSICNIMNLEKARSLVSYNRACSAWKHPMDGGAWWAAVHGVAKSGMIEWLHFHFSFSCTGKGNGNPLQCSCLENPRDGEPGGLPSMGSHRVGHYWSDLAVAVAVERTGCVYPHVQPAKIVLRFSLCICEVCHFIIKPENS